MRKRKALSSVIATFVIFLIFMNCGNPESTSAEEEEIPDSTVQLVKTVCSACHDFVPPEMLDRKTWIESTLPFMAPKMGIFEIDGKPLRSEKGDKDVPADYFPEKPMVTPAQFRQIMRYFEVLAPEQLPIQKRTEQIGAETPLFKPVFPNLPPTSAPMTTFVKIREKEQKIVVGVAGDYNRLGYFSKDAVPFWVLSLPSAPSWVEFENQTDWMITCMGSVMPSTKKEGKLLKIKVNGTTQPAQPVEILNRLPRPVQIRQVDMDGNGSKDYLINGFGHLTGKLYWKRSANAEEKVLRDFPGAIQTEIIDWDGDGKQDVVTLFTQNREGIYLFRNLGGGNYEEKVLLQFSPVFGSSSFAIADINKDGKKDIVYTAGDNADYSVILKYYHGVYVYLNKGNNQFEESYFYPIHGCYKALVRDFDMDGDLDMVTISFFADYLTQHKEALLYFENDGKMNFKPFSIAGFDKGRWLTCDAGDVDGDGDVDVIVGNFSIGPESFMSPDMPQKFAAEPVFMLLENKTK